MPVVKTAVGIDADVFAEGEELARQLGISRSDLYTRALSHLIRQHRRRSIRDAINDFQATLSEEERDEERRLTADVRRASTRTMRDAINREAL